MKFKKIFNFPKGNNLPVKGLNSSKKVIYAVMYLSFECLNNLSNNKLFPIKPFSPRWIAQAGLQRTFACDKNSRYMCFRFEKLKLYYIIIKIYKIHLAIKFWLIPIKNILLQNQDLNRLKFLFREMFSYIANSITHSRYQNNSPLCSKCDHQICSQLLDKHIHITLYVQMSLESIDNHPAIKYINENIIIV